jgi:hypothetical protein
MRAELICTRQRAKLLDVKVCFDGRTKEKCEIGRRVIELYCTRNVLICLMLS